MYKPEKQLSSNHCILEEIRPFLTKNVLMKNPKEQQHFFVKPFLRGNIIKNAKSRMKPKTQADSLKLRQYCKESRGIKKKSAKGSRKKTDILRSG